MYVRTFLWSLSIPTARSCNISSCTSMVSLNLSIRPLSVVEEEEYSLPVFFSALIIMICWVLFLCYCCYCCCYYGSCFAILRNCYYYYNYHSYCNWYKYYLYHCHHNIKMTAKQCLIVTVTLSIANILLSSKRRWVSRC